MTGRRSLSLVPDAQINSMAANQYQQLLQEGPLSNDPIAVNTVRRVGERIRNAVEEFYTEKGIENQLKGFDWEYNVIEQDTINAFCMPGGKIVFYRGILPICQNETGVAMVMGHEVAHALARHGTERMSQGLVATAAAVGMDVGLQGDKDKQLYVMAFNLGAQFGVLLPYSRKHESEADQMGVELAARAGYDPMHGALIWERMKEENSAAPPEFMSTHPSHDTRIDNLNEWGEELTPLYEEKKGSFPRVSKKRLF